jgi:hypothetical protein
MIENCLDHAAKRDVRQLGAVHFARNFAVPINQSTRIIGHLRPQLGKSMIAGRFIHDGFRGLKKRQNDTVATLIPKQ